MKNDSGTRASGESRVFAREADCFTRYLIRKPATQRLVGRYEEALEKLGLLLPRSKYDRRMLSTAGLHPLAAEALDTAAALLDAKCLLRKRLFVLAGLLETDTEFAERFLLPPPARPVLALRLIGSGLRAGFWLLLGVPALWILRALP